MESVIASSADKPATEEEESLESGNKEVCSQSPLCPLGDEAWERAMTQRHSALRHENGKNKARIPVAL